MQITDDQFIELSLIFFKKNLEDMDTFFKRVDGHHHNVSNKKKLDKDELIPLEEYGKIRTLALLAEYVGKKEQEEKFRALCTAALTFDDLNTKINKCRQITEKVEPHYFDHLKQKSNLKFTRDRFGIFTPRQKTVIDSFTNMSAYISMDIKRGKELSLAPK